MAAPRPPLEALQRQIGALHDAIATLERVKRLIVATQEVRSIRPGATIQKDWRCTWSAGDVAVLKREWARGTTALAIGKMLERQRERHVIYVKAHELGLPRRDQHKGPRKATIERAPRATALIPPPVAPILDYLNKKHVNCERRSDGYYLAGKRVPLTRLVDIANRKRAHEGESCFQLPVKP